MGCQPQPGLVGLHLRPAHPPWPKGGGQREAAEAYGAPNPSVVIGQRWRIALLPFMEQDNLLYSFNFLGNGGNPTDPYAYIDSPDLAVCSIRSRTDAPASVRAAPEERSVLRRPHAGVPGTHREIRQSDQCLHYRHANVLAVMPGRNLSMQLEPHRAASARTALQAAARR
jgi:hypothetical protein